MTTATSTIANGEAQKPKKKKKRGKIPNEAGIIVWDGDVSHMPPIALVLSGDRYDDAGSEDRPASSSLFVHTLPPDGHDPVQMWRDTRSLTRLNEGLKKIYNERRVTLEAAGKWEETTATIKRVLLQRLLRNPEVPIERLWGHHMEMASTGEPCPATQDEAAAWIRAHAPPAPLHESDDGKDAGTARASSSGAAGLAASTSGAH